MNKKLLVIFLIFLGLAGLLARFWQFSRIPLSLYWDEVAIGLDARSLLSIGKDLSNKSWFQPLFFSYGDYKAPVYIWLVALLGKFISVSELTVRLPSLLAFIGTSLVLFKLIKKISPQKSLLSYFSLAGLFIMPWSFHFSRIGMESHLSLFWLILAVYLVVSQRLILAAFSVILGIFTYISLRFLAPVLYLTAFLLYSRKKIKQFLIGSVLIGLSLLLLVKSPYYTASQQYRLSNDNLITSTERKPVKLKKFFINYSSYFDPQFLLISGDPNLRHHSGFGGELLMVQGILLLLGLVSLLKYSRQETYLILVWLFLSPVIAALVNETPHASRAIYMIIPLSWLTGLGFTQLKPKSVISIILIPALALNFLVYLHDYFSHYPDRSASAWINPYKQTALKFKDKPLTQPVYVSNKLYKPELYFAFYLNDLSLFKPNQKIFYFLPEPCPDGAICYDFE